MPYVYEGAAGKKTVYDPDGDVEGRRILTLATH